MKKNTTQQAIKIEVIDLFCGIGGLTYGLQQADISVLAGLDNDKSCEYSFKQNNNCKFIAANISKYDFEKMKSIYSKDSIRVLVGCAPCQPFSSHTFKAKNKKSDTRWNLINYFIKAIKVLSPHIISMENVRGLIKTNVFKNFLNEVKKLGYQVNYKIIYCPDYGIPQNRSRLVRLGSKLGKINLPEKTHTKGNYITVKDIIKKLPKIKSGEINQKDPIHRAKNLSTLNIRRIRQSKPSGSWKDWNKELLTECYKKKSGQSYASVYGRMNWDKVSPTITTQFCNYGSGRFGHPKQDRALSIREGALLQTFPEHYDFGNKISMTTTSRHIGNAVPPKLGFVIGKKIKEHVKNYYETTK